MRQQINGEKKNKISTSSFDKCQQGCFALLAVMEGSNSLSLSNLFTPRDARWSGKHEKRWAISAVEIFFCFFSLFRHSLNFHLLISEKACRTRHFASQLAFTINWYKLENKSKLIFKRNFHSRVRFHSLMICHWRLFSHVFFGELMVFLH